MRKLTFIDTKFLVGILFVLTLIGCGSPSETPSAASSTEATATEAATDTAAAVPATETTAAETTATAAASDTTVTAAATETVAMTPEAMISTKLVESFGDDAKTIHITFVDGKATLTGKVNERSTQELAEEVARYFPEVKKVDNQLTAVSDRGLLKGQMKDEAADAALESAAKSALAKEIGEHAKDVKIEAAAGVVSLRGTVPDDTRLKLALDSMLKVKDVKKVVNLIRVK